MKRKKKKNWLTHKSEVDFEDAAQPIEDFEDVVQTQQMHHSPPRTSSVNEGKRFDNQIQYTKE